MPEQEQKLHYITFYFQRFIASTKGWKDDEVGAYVKLLIEQADRGYIPEDPQELSRLITTYKKNWAMLSKKFKAGEIPGTLQNCFMKEVREDAVRKIQINASNGKKGGRPKKAEKPTGLQLKTDGLATENQTANRNESEPKPIPVTSNQEPVNTAIAVLAVAEPVGIDRVAEVAGLVWANQRWVENVCIGQQMKPDDLKKWMAQYNASICNDVIPDFDQAKYQKMFGGWLNSQKSKGYSLQKVNENHAPALKKVQ